MMESLLLFLEGEEARGSDGGGEFAGLPCSLIISKGCLLISPPTNEASVTMVPQVVSPHPGLSPHFLSFHYSTLHHLTSRVLRWLHKVAYNTPKIFNIKEFSPGYFLG